MGKYNTKQYIIARTDLNMPAGKLAAQAGHASVGALLSISTQDCSMISIKYDKNPALKEWIEGDYAKVCLGVDSEETLKQCYQIAKDNNLPCHLVIDNGTTIFHDVKTPTCIGIGPCYSEVLEPLFKHLKLYK